jgi:pantoate--beta-alanine ligase
MQIITKVKELRAILTKYKNENKTIGFVPTMGALHDGHLSLVNNAKKQTNIVVCSIFVNPTQFNNKNDLKKYPRTLDKDAIMLKAASCDIVFAPSVSEIYPKNLDTNINIDFKGLDKVMEGKFRPGHFEGMARVVKRLLDIVEPNKLFMGQKDFQQFTLVQFMINKFKIKTQLIVCPIKREKNGLAMSSRNERLSKQLREKASLIYKTLQSAYRKINTHSIKEIEDYAISKLTIPDFNPEYFSIVDGYNLKPVKDINKHKYVVACVAVWVGDVRLIDNKIFKKED